MTRLSKAPLALLLSAVLVGATAVLPVTSSAESGRYKKAADGSCYWDAKDDGPNQCTPAKKGRYKQEGDKCVWDANDTGPDQCTPKKGRYKKDGDKCYFDANDSGPDQCTPKKP